MKAENKTIFRLVAAAAVLLAALIVSCEDDPVSAEPEDEIELAGSSWKLTSVESVSDTLFDAYENGIWQVPETAQYLLEFTPDSSVYAFLYCEECPDGEGSRFEIAGEDSLSINLICESRSICQKNIPVRERLESVVAVEQEGETLTAEYVLTGDENEEFWGILHFSSADNVRPEKVPFEVLRGQWPVRDCWFNSGNLEFGQDNEDFSDVELIITTQEEFDHYITCNEDTEVDMEEYFLLAGVSQAHHQCVDVFEIRLYQLNNLLSFDVSITELDCQGPPNRGIYIIKVLKEHQMGQIDFKVYWRESI